MTTTQPTAPATPPADQLVQTQHTVVINGVEIAYTATAGVIIMKEEAEKDGVSAGEQARAGIFFVAYTRDDVSDASRRPITFAFNGGPGSSSVWLHLGLLGPQRVLMNEEGWPLPPPGRLVPNPYSLLDVSDLVFIDPVSTGYSRPVAGESAKQFHDFRKDIESVGDFIRLYTSRYGRWLSPKYLAGESYGTTRAAGLAGYLQERHGLYLNGLMLISAVLHFQTLSFDHGNDLPYMLFCRPTPLPPSTTAGSNQNCSAIWARLCALLKRLRSATMRWPCCKAISSIRPPLIASPPNWPATPVSAATILPARACAFATTGL